MRRDAHRAVEHDDALERVAERKDAVRLVVLLLLAYKDEAHLSVVNHILYLLLGCCSIERDRYKLHAIGTEVGNEILKTVLREHSYLVVGLRTEIEKGVARLLHQLREAVVTDLLPY